MYVRLAFAVAAHLEREVLIVDEVLAVGDTAFQKKCLGKMQGVAQTGRTVLFVTHNMAAVENLCRRAIVLQRGHIVFDGPAKEGIDHYYQSVADGETHPNSAQVDLTTHSGRPPVYRPTLTSLDLFNGDGKPLNAGLKIGVPQGSDPLSHGPTHWQSRCLYGIRNSFGSAGFHCAHRLRSEPAPEGVSRGGNIRL
jgi:lipopolysaccharide transport system ATP-binding protein